MRTSFTTSMSDILNRMNPAAQIGKLGTYVKELFDRQVLQEAKPYQIKIELDEDASGGVDEILSSDYDLEILDVAIIATAALTDGTLTLQNGEDDITDAMTCAVANTVSRAGTIDQSKNTISAGEAVTLLTSGSDGRAIVILTVVEA